MLETFPLFSPDVPHGGPKELAVLSLISQTLFQPFSVEDSLLVVLTALTAGSGVGFNRAMLFRASEESLRGDLWLGPRSAEEARTIWDVLSTPGIGALEIIEHNRQLLRREADSLTPRIRPLVFPLTGAVSLPALCAARREIVLVRDAWREELVDRDFLKLIAVDEFLAVPLISQDEIFGAVILDNAYSRQAIGPKDIKLAGLCGLIAGNAISANLLHRKIVNLEKLAALGELSMFVTHQLRNPLTAIGGFTEQLAKAPEDEALRRRNLGIIRREIGRLEEILARLGRFAKTNAGASTSFDLAAALRDLVRQDDIRRESEGREFAVEIEDPLPAIRGDPTDVQEAVRNLLNNAIEATPFGGIVALRGWRKDPWVIVEVRDGGPGMPAGAKAKLFSPFFSTKERGLGLGLLFVKRVMESLGGKIDVESEPGRGTRVRLYFPNAG